MDLFVDRIEFAVTTAFNSYLAGTLDRVLANCRKPTYLHFLGPKRLKLGESDDGCQWWKDNMNKLPNQFEFYCIDDEKQ
jgi:hypothetical protein